MSLHGKTRIAALCVLLALFALVGARAGVTVSESADDFTLRQVDGSRTVTLSQLKGKPALVVFWATWCPPCRREIPVLKDITTKYQPKGLQVLAVAVDYRESQEQVLQFQKTNDLPYTVLWDAQSTVSDHYGVSGIPTLVLVDPSGVIRYRGNGVDDELMGLIDKFTSSK